MMKNMPTSEPVRVSYIIRTRNRAQCLSTTLDNVREFPALKDELLVMDGGSTDDTAGGILRATEVYDDFPPLNIAVGKGYTIAELAEMIREAVGYGDKIEYDTSKSDGALRKTGDTQKATSVLGWEPRVEIRDGIRRTLDWLADNYDKAILS
jgi:nucleoside-diphosphate-sugar epimerase